MKKYLIALSILLTLGAGLPAAAQTSQKAEQEELVDSTTKDQLEAFSDTTLAAADSAITRNINIVDEWGDEEGRQYLKNLMKDLDSDDLAGMLFVLLIILIIFVISPLVIFGLLLYFIFRNRKQKMRLAEMAMRNGQPIPDQLLHDNDPDDDAATYQRGMRQLFLGIGLMVFLGFTAGKVGLGIGALVFLIGLGKVMISRKPKANPNDINTHKTNNNNIREYE